MNFFIGQRVRILRSSQGLAGREARIYEIGPTNSHTYGYLETGHFVEVDGVGRTGVAGIRLAYPAQDLEPILPSGAQPSEFTTLHDLLTSLEGVCV
jgi:hypothetical protein